MDRNSSAWLIGKDLRARTSWITLADNRFYLKLTLIKFVNDKRSGTLVKRLLFICKYRSCSGFLIVGTSVKRFFERIRNVIVFNPLSLVNLLSVTISCVNDSNGLRSSHSVNEQLSNEITRRDGINVNLSVIFLIGTLRIEIVNKC